MTEREKRNLAILGTLRRRGPMSRPEISQELGLNIVTVSNYVEDFLNQSIVFEKEFDISEGGRRPILLDINPEAGLVIGVGLNLLSVVGALINLKGKLVSRVCWERNSVTVKDVVNCVTQAISALLEKNKDVRDKIKGIGIGIAGIVNKKDGSIRWPEKVDHNYNYASVYVPLKDVLEREFGLSVFIENDATSACFGEQWLGLEPEIKNLIYMFSGVGCGIMINGEIYTGATGSAGEVAIYNPKDDPPFNCQAGTPCFLKRWEIDFGMCDEARMRISNFGQTKQEGKRLLELTGQKPEGINLKTVLRAAKEGDPLALELTGKAAKQLGVRIAYLVNLLNPEMVIIGGGLEEAGDVFLNTVRATVDEWAFEEMASSVRIIYSELGENGIALGAASLVMRQVFAKA